MMINLHNSLIDDGKWASVRWKKSVKQMQGDTVAEVDKHGGYRLTSNARWLIDLSRRTFFLILKQKFRCIFFLSKQVKRD